MTAPAVTVKPVAKVLSEKQGVLGVLDVLPVGLESHECLRQGADLEAAVNRDLRALRTCVDLEARPIASSQIAAVGPKRQARHRYEPAGPIEAIDRTLVLVLVVVDQASGHVAEKPCAAHAQPPVGFGLEGHREVALGSRLIGFVEDVGVDAGVNQ